MEEEINQIISRIHKDIRLLEEKFGVKVVYDDFQENSLVLYFNEEYGKVFVDKSFISRR